MNGSVGVRGVRERLACIGEPAYELAQLKKAIHVNIHKRLSLVIVAHVVVLLYLTFFLKKKKTNGFFLGLVLNHTKTLTKPYFVYP